MQPIENRNPRPMCTRLPQFLKEVAKVSEYWKVARDRVPALCEIVDRENRHGEDQTAKSD